MVVRIKDKERLQGSVTPSTLNSETDVINLSDQTDDYIIEGCLDLSNLAVGDTVVIKTYVAVDGSNQRKIDEVTFSNEQENPVVRIPAMTVPYNGKFRCTITQTEGTLRTIYYTFIVQIMEEI